MRPMTLSVASADPDDNVFLDRVHTQQRAKERFGVVLSDEDYIAMRRQCQSQRGICIGRKNALVKIWLVWWPSAEKIVPVYYGRGRIMSVLPTQIVTSKQGEKS